MIFKLPINFSFTYINVKDIIINIYFYYDPNDMGCTPMRPENRILCSYLRIDLSLFVHSVNFAPGRSSSLFNFFSLARGDILRESSDIFWPRKFQTFCKKFAFYVNIAKESNKFTWTSLFMKLLLLTTFFIEIRNRMKFQKFIIRLTYFMINCHDFKFFRE